MAHGNNLHAYLQDATDNANATLILARVIFWNKLGKGVVIDGVKWTPNSCEDWGRESRLSRQQARAAFAVFRARHLVETCIIKTRTGRLLHTRPTARTLSIAAGAEDGGIGCPQPQDGLPAVPTQVDSQPISQGETQEETQGDIKDSETLPEGSAPHPFSAQSKQGSGEADKEPEQMKMTEVEKHVKGQKLLHKPDSVKVLEFIWKEKIAEDTGAIVVLSGKEYGQLKAFQKKCPPGKSEAVLRWTLDHWNQFSKGVMADANLKGTPESPLLGFVLLWASYAVIGWTQASPPGPIPVKAKHEAPATTVATETVQSISPPKKFPGSIEEILS